MNCEDLLSVNIVAVNVMFLHLAVFLSSDQFFSSNRVLCEERTRSNERWT